MKILVCAATAAEAWACRKGIAEAGLVSGDFAILQTGMGMAAARSSLHEYLVKAKSGQNEDGLPRLIISSGFAGLWRGSLAVGDWVSASALWKQDAQGGFDSIGLSMLAFADVEAGAMVSVEKIQKIPADLPLILANGNLLVDMESAALAQTAFDFEIPFGVLRMITDTPEHPLPEFVSSFSQALLAKDLEEKIRFGGRGFFDLFKEPSGVFKLMQAGKSWSEQLVDGWRQHATPIATIHVTSRK